MSTSCPIARRLWVQHLIENDPLQKPKVSGYGQPSYYPRKQLWRLPKEELCLLRHWLHLGGCTAYAPLSSKLTGALPQETISQLFTVLFTLRKNIPQPLLSKKVTNPFQHPVHFFPNHPSSPSHTVITLGCYQELPSDGVGTSIGWPLIFT